MDHFPERMDRAEYDRALMVKAAWYYYVEDYTQQKISDLLGVSRSKVVSLLETARQTASSNSASARVTAAGCRRSGR